MFGALSGLPTLSIILNGFSPFACLRSAFLSVLSDARKFRIFHFLSKIPATPCHAFIFQRIFIFRESIYSHFAVDYIPRQIGCKAFLLNYSQ